jgi:N-acetylglucosaminyldiphosphoundecaprenol N-acetyl-beta-D-mannosaminyltransferase
MRVDKSTVYDSADQITTWAKKRESRYVCLANIHMCIEAYDSVKFKQVVNNSDLVLADGKPLSACLKLFGVNGGQQVRGADITRELLSRSSSGEYVIGFYGGTPEAIRLISKMISRDYPNVKLGCAISPPFRQLSEKESNNFINQINDSGVQILLVGLGCPKQEQWMAKHKIKVNAVMVGVGAVFDFLSGTKKEAPKWIQDIGFEWLFRLLSEPRRLWKRYLIYSPRFIWYCSLQFIKKQ